MRPVAFNDRDQPVVDHQQAAAEFGALAGFDRTAGDVNQPIAVALDQAPAGTAEPRIDAEYAIGCRAMVPLITPRPPAA